MSESQSDPPQNQNTDAGSPSGAGDDSLILVVESNQSTRDVMTLVLERYCRVQSVATYQQALRRTRRVQFDLIFVTVKRRGQQAASDLLETLRAREAYAEVPIVIIDGTSSGGTETQSRPIGGDATLRMPFERAELVDVLRRHLGGE